MVTWNGPLPHCQSNTRTYAPTAALQHRNTKAAAVSSLIASTLLNVAPGTKPHAATPSLPPLPPLPPLLPLLLIQQTPTPKSHSYYYLLLPLLPT